MSGLPKPTVIDEVDVFDSMRALLDDGIDLDDRGAVERVLINPYCDTNLSIGASKPRRPTMRPAVCSGMPLVAAASCLTRASRERR